MAKTVITPERAVFIREHYLIMSSTKIAKALGISDTVVQRYLKKNNLKVPSALYNSWKSEGLKRPLSEEEQNFIHNHIHTHSTKWIAEKLKRSNVTIHKEAHRLGYAKLMKEKSEKSRYKKGRTPENKGVKMSDEIYEKCKHTFFQKGNLPHNTLPDYSEVVRDRKKTPYIYIKIPGKRKMIPKHRYLWEEAYGVIPKGFNIIFKNGNTLDCRLKNLECVSDKQLMQQNTIHQYPKELKTAMRQISKIKKIIEKEN